MIRHGFLGFAFATLVAIAAIEPSAYAGETESKTLFAQGRQLRQEGKCADAIVVFRRALDTFPEGLGSLRNIAECEQEIGMFASARRDYWDLKVAVLQANAPKYDGWAEDAGKAHSSLQDRVAKVKILVQGDQPEGTRILVNGKTFDPRLVGVELEQDNGPLTVEIHFGASTPISKTVTLKDASRETIELTIPKYVPSTKPGGGNENGNGNGGNVEPPIDHGKANTAKAMKIGGGVAIGVGGLAAIGLGAAIGIEQSALSSVKDVCPTLKGCDPSVQSDVDRGKLASVLVNVFAVTAGVGVGVGVTLILTAPKADTPAAAAPKAVSLGFTPLPGGGAMGFGGSF